MIERRLNTLVTGEWSPSDGPILHRALRKSHRAAQAIIPPVTQRLERSLSIGRFGSGAFSLPPAVV